MADHILYPPLSLVWTLLKTQLVEILSGCKVKPEGIVELKAAFR